MSNEKKKYVIDLIILMSMPFITIYIIYTPLMSLLKNMDFGLGVFLFRMFFQLFSVGMGAILLLVRKENFADYGIVKKNIIKSVLLSFLAYMPHIVLTLLMRKDFVYMPFQYVINPKYLISLSLIERIVTYIAIIIVWEILEIFTYVVISDKINKIFKLKNLFLNPGAILCATFVVLIHALVGTMTFGWLDAITTFILIYGTLIVREYTQNSIGGILWFTLCWNTFG